MIRRVVKINNFYLEIVHRLFFEISQNQNDCIRQKFFEIQIKIRSISMFDDNLDLNENQYIAYQRIISNFFSFTFRKFRDTNFFVTNSERTEKSFLLHILVTWCNDRKLKILKMISIDIVAENVKEKTIHNNLHINFQKNSNHESLLFDIFRMKKTMKNFKKIKIFIIDEIFMISNEIFNFVSKLFVKIHKNAFAFENFHVIVFDDFLQLFSIRNRQIFHFFVWKIFISLFLKRSKKHDNDSKFERFLKTIRFDKIIDEIMNIFHQKKQEFRIENFIHMCIFFSFSKKRNFSFERVIITTSLQSQCCRSQNWK